MSTLVWLNGLPSLPAGLDPHAQNIAGASRAVAGSFRRGTDHVALRARVPAPHSSSPQPLRTGPSPLRARLQARTEGRKSAWQHGRI
jgi:hypothetical protein